MEGRRRGGGYLLTVAGANASYSHRRHVLLPVHWGCCSASLGGRLHCAHVRHPAPVMSLSLPRSYTDADVLTENKRRTQYKHINVIFHIDFYPGVAKNVCMGSFGYALCIVTWPPSDLNPLCQRGAIQLANLAYVYHI